MRPSILWILTTQWRAQACGYAGDSNVRTPQLDLLASNSLNFGQAITPHPFGPFARAALLTGIASPSNGIRDYFDPLPDGTRTLAHDLEERGYSTSFFGKWHLSRRDPASPLVGEAHARSIVPDSCRGGFGYWEGFESGFLLNDPWLHGTHLPEPTQFKGYQPEVLVERALGWLKARTEPRPWFCVVSTEPPHPPYDAPCEGPAVSGDLISLSPNVPPAAQKRARHDLAGYYRHIYATDRALAPLIHTAEQAGAITVFTSVHGDMHGAHGHFRKGWPHEESIRVPLLVRHPSEAPRRDDSAVSLLDLPSMAKAWADGQTWRAASDFAAISMPSVVELPDQCDRVWSGLRSRYEKLILNADGSPWLYFNLKDDPFERQNLAGDPRASARIADLKAKISGRGRTSTP